MVRAGSSEIKRAGAFAFEFSPKLFGYFSARKLALEKLHLDLGVVPPNMVDPTILFENDTSKA